MKKLETLKEDIFHVLQTGEGWTNEILEWVLENHRSNYKRQMRAKSDKPRGPTLRMSNIGHPCERKTWNEFNVKGFIPEKLSGKNYGKFILGDMIESFTLGLVKAAGHKVEGCQEEVKIGGIVGHRDAIIDGMQFDVKSASPYAFEKFKYNRLMGYWKSNRDKSEVWVPREEVDSFGYISQNTSYLYASLDDERITYKNKVGFLAIEKSLFDIAVDIYDVSEELKNKEKEIERRKEVCCLEEPPEVIPWGTTFASTRDKKPDPEGNIKLTAACSYCEWKHHCYPNLRTFVSSTGPLYLSKVVKEPRMKEVTDE